MAVTTCTNDRCFDLRGLSGDVKPLEYNGVAVGNGSTFFCVDSGDVYMFDEENQEWKAI